MDGKAVLLTGASGAIGSEVARKLAGRGARLVLSGRRVERLEALAGEIAAGGPAMVRRGEGTIVNVGSMARVSPFPHLGVYSASRAALSTIAEVLDMELRPRGVSVVEVALGPVDTAASRENRVLAGADRWLDGRPGLGEAEGAAAATVAAAIGDAEG